MRRHPRVVLFDLDGTLSDSAPGILGSLRHAFAVNGLPPIDAETERAILGPPFYETLPPLVGDAAVPAVIAAYREHYGNGGMFDTRLFDGVGPLVASLAGHGITLAIATSKPESYAVPIVEHLGIAEFFSTIGGDTLDGALATKALVVGAVLERLGRPDPAEVLMIGDRMHDVVGARAHGVDAIAVRWGYAVPGELEASEPALICATPDEVAAALGLPPADACAEAS